jgi:dihydroorotate dehydrogenase (fumarate)
MLASALLQRGPECLTTILAEMAEWLDRRGYLTIGDIRGLVSRQRCESPGAYERANYAKALATFVH